MDIDYTVRDDRHTFCIICTHVEIVQAAVSRRRLTAFGPIVASARLSVDERVGSEKIPKPPTFQLRNAYFRQSSRRDAKKDSSHGRIHLIPNQSGYFGAHIEWSSRVIRSH